MPLTNVEKQRNADVSRPLQVNSASDLLARSAIAQMAGMQFVNARDVDTNCGYNKDPQLDDYRAKYERRGIASTIVDAPAQTTWRKPPMITDGSEGKSKFMREWGELRDRLKVYQYLERVDRLSGIGSYGVLLIGTKDGRLGEPLERVGGPQDVIFLSTFSETYAQITSYVNETDNPRFGRPEMYDIDLSTDIAGLGRASIGKKPVHHSRIIHVAEGLLENEVFGEPRLQKIFNRLEDLDKVVGSSAEAWWQLVVKGYALSAKEGF